MQYIDILKKWHFWLLVIILSLPSLSQFYSYPYSSAGNISGILVGMALIYSLILFIYNLRKKKNL